jgi:hypothetical protein
MTRPLRIAFTTQMRKLIFQDLTPLLVNMLLGFFAGNS